MTYRRSRGHDGRYRARGRCMGVALLLTLAGACSSAAAEQQHDGSRMHVGVGLAGLSFKDHYRGVVYDDVSAGWQAYAGYRIRERIAIELARKSFAGIAVRDIAGSGVERLDISTKLDVSVIRAALELPISEVLGWRRDISVFGSAGFHDSRARREATPAGGGPRESETARDSGLVAGAGVLMGVGGFELRGYVEGLDMRRIERAREIGVAVQFRF